MNATPNVVVDDDINIANKMFIRKLIFFLLLSTLVSTLKKKRIKFISHKIIMKPDLTVPFYDMTNSCKMICNFTQFLCSNYLHNYESCCTYSYPRLFCLCTIRFNKNYIFLLYNE